MMNETDNLMFDKILDFNINVQGAFELNIGHVKFPKSLDKKIEEKCGEIYYLISDYLKNEFPQKLTFNENFTKPLEEGVREMLQLQELERLESKVRSLT